MGLASLDNSSIVQSITQDGEQMKFSWHKNGFPSKSPCHDSEGWKPVCHIREMFRKEKRLN